MIALLKYEWRKTRTAKLMLLVLAVVEELGFLWGILRLEPGGRPDGLVGTSLFLLFLTAFGGILLIGLQSVMVLQRDLNTKQGYMLFMTPRNSYQILGAKLLENGLSLAVAGGFFFLLGLLDASLLVSRLGLDEFWNMAKGALNALDEAFRFSWDSMLCHVAHILASWLATVSIAYLAVIVSASLLNGKRFNVFTSFVSFIFLTVLMGRLMRLCTIGVAGIDAVLLVRSAIALGYAVAVYAAAAWIMERHLSV